MAFTIESLRDWSPQYGTKKWIVINSLCCLASLILFCLTFFHVDSIDKQVYVIYNVIICLVWCIEVMMIIRFQKIRGTWQQYAEFVLAAYFFVDATLSILRWSLAEIHQWHMLVDSILDFVVYAAYLVYTFRTELQQHVPTKDEGADVYIQQDFVCAPQRPGPTEGSQ